jgi:hypothetical protein
MLQIAMLVVLNKTYYNTVDNFSSETSRPFVNGLVHILDPIIQIAEIYHFERAAYFWA